MIIMCGILRFVRADLKRRIFVWFGATILVTMVAVVIVVNLIWLVDGKGLGQQLERVHAFTNAQFARVWTDPVARKHLMQDISNNFSYHVRLEDAEGNMMDMDGAKCSGRQWKQNVYDKKGGLYGSLLICDNENQFLQSMKVAIMLFVIVLVFWFGSWMVARSIARPLEDLSRIAQDLGQGDLKSRSKIAASSGGEIALLADSLHDMAAKLERQLDDQKTLLAGVSHELRTPLGHLRMIIEIGRSSQMTPQRFDELEREVLEMDDLVDQLLATSRLNFEIKNLHTIDAATFMIDVLERTGTAPEVLEVYDNVAFMGDTTLMHRALANLIHNAINHGGGVERIVVKRRADMLAIVVEDLGTGLPKDRLVSLFEPFVQNTTSSGSLGLGLFLVKRIAMAHGGDVIAEANTPQGACVGFFVPVV